MLETLVNNSLLSYKDKPLLIGLSGGADSLSLFLIAQKLGYTLTAVHIDHGWREESQDESQQLEKLCLRFDIPFYLKTCARDDFKGNLENAARVIRLNFFREVAAKTGAAGVLLGHHANDLVENTLKKLCEGAPLYALSSMQTVTDVEGLTLIRPLLGIKKAALLKYLGSEAYFEDTTNFSADFLRGRMRETLLPFLSQTFGKNIEDPLIKVAQDSQELQVYLASQIKEFEEVSGPFGIYLDLRTCTHVFLLKALIHQKLKEAGLAAFHEDIKALSQAIIARKANFTKIFDGRKLIADRGFLFILKAKVPLLNEWKVTYEVLEEVTDWKMLWKGRGVGLVSDKNIRLDFESHHFDKWWTNHKIPAFLRSIVPLVIKSGEPEYEFLSGKIKFPRINGVKIAIQHCAP